MVNILDIHSDLCERYNLVGTSEARFYTIICDIIGVITEYINDNMEQLITRTKKTYHYKMFIKELNFLNDTELEFIINKLNGK